MAAAPERRARDDDEEDDVDDPPRASAVHALSKRSVRPGRSRIGAGKYVARLQAILDALEIPDLGREERTYLQRLLCRADHLRNLTRNDSRAAARTM
jgi:hypothetical protein